MRSRILLFLALLFATFHARALESWQAALAKMPLKTNVLVLTKTNTVPLLLGAFQKNDAAKGLILMPGATDELFFFERVEAWLTNDHPTLLDAIAALTNQTHIEATFRAPFILLHSPEDPLETMVKIEDAPTAERIKKRRFQKTFVTNDRDWQGIQPSLEFYTATTISPPANSSRANHFFRHFFVAYDLTAWEALEATAFAGKTTFTIQKRQILFEPDKRFRKRPTIGPR